MLTVECAEQVLKGSHDPSSVLHRLCGQPHLLYMLFIFFDWEVLVLLGGEPVLVSLCLPLTVIAMHSTVVTALPLPPCPAPNCTHYPAPVALLPSARCLSRRARRSRGLQPEV